MNEEKVHLPTFLVLPSETKYVNSTTPALFLFSKILLSKFIKNFVVESVQEPKSVPELIFRPTNVYLKVKERK